MREDRNGVELGIRIPLLTPVPPTPVFPLDIDLSGFWSEDVFAETPVRLNVYTVDEYWADRFPWGGIE